MTNCIIGASDRYSYNQLQYWVNSINMSGFKGDIIIIAFNMDIVTINKLLEKGVKIYGIGTQDFNSNLVYQFNRPVHVERFFHIYQFLREYGKNYQFVATTDIKDVIFQSDISIDLPNLLETKKIIIGSEGLRYCDESWGNQNLFETFGPLIYNDFKEKTIYNVGVIAGYSDYVKDLCLNIYLSAIDRPIQICDQAVFNVMIQSQPYLDIIHYTSIDDKWVVHMGTTNDPSKETIFDPLLLNSKPIIKYNYNNNMSWVVNSSDGEFAIVHQYDRNPTTKEIFQKYYGDPV